MKQSMKVKKFSISIPIYKYKVIKVEADRQLGGNISQRCQELMDLGRAYEKQLRNESEQNSMGREVRSGL